LVFVAACGVAVITVITGAVDVQTATFQLTAIVVAGGLTEAVVRGVIRQAQAQELNQQRLERFTMDAAHELRNPLAALTSDLETSLLGHRSEAELTSTIARALNNIDRLSRVTESLLILSRADSGNLVTAPKAVQLADVVEEAKARWSSHATKLGINLVSTIVGDGDIDGDELLISRVVDNLLDNAFRHTPSGGRVSIDLKQAHPPMKWELTVSDTGDGIPQHLRPAIFERFVRGDPSRSRATGGAGLGLALCLSIINAHEGRILVDPGVGGGARIVALFPPGKLSRSGPATI